MNGLERIIFQSVAGMNALGNLASATFPAYLAQRLQHQPMTFAICEQAAALPYLLGPDAA